MEKKFSKEHEWITVDGDVITIGISDYAQKALGDVVYVSLIRDIDEDIEKGDEIAEIESVKSVSQIYAPVAGKIIEFNSIFEDEENSGIINSDPYDEGWILKIKVSNMTQIDDLWDEKTYESYINEL